MNSLNPGEFFFLIWLQFLLELPHKFRIYNTFAMIENIPDVINTFSKFRVKMFLKLMLCGVGFVYEKYDLNIVHFKLLILFFVF